MMAKLIKHEYRATARTFVPLLGAVLALTGLSWRSLRLGSALWAERMGIFHKVFAAAGGILTVFTFFTLVALMICAVVVTIQRFYKNVLGDEGYLTLTLPATPAQHIAAKLIVGVAWTAAALALAVLSAFALGTSAVEVTQGDMQVHHMTMAEVSAGFAGYFGFPLWKGVGIVVLTFLSGVVDTYLMTYFCMAVGSQWPQQRLAASIGVFVGLDFIRRVLFVIVFAVVGTTIAAPGTALYQTLTGLTAGSVFQTVPAFFCILCVVESAVFFFAARWLLTKRLNLA